MAGNEEQAKLEAEKLLIASRKQQTASKHKASAETARKAAEASQLFDEIGKIQSGSTTSRARPAARAEEDEDLESGASLLAERLIKLEEQQQMARDQISKLVEAKKKLEVASRKAREQADKLQQEHNAKLQRQLNTLIADKEKEYERIREEILLLRERSEQESALLKAQRDAARTMAQEQQEATEAQLTPAGEGGGLKKFLIITGSVLLVLLMIGVFLLLFIDKIPFLHQLVAGAPPQPTVTAVKTPEPTAEVKEAGTAERTDADGKPQKTQLKLPTKPVKPIRAYRDRLRNGGTGPVMIEVPGGEYLLGGLPHRPYQEELPLTPVKLRNFSISKQEITVAEYRRFVQQDGKHRMPEVPPRWKGKDDKFPIVNVSWEDAADYAQWLSSETGRQYRLPSEREWEYAASAGMKTNYPWGEMPGDGRANCADCGSRWDGEQAAPVGQFPPNPLGLQDVIGNVQEWVYECRHVNYVDTPLESHIWEGGDCSRRMIRGGSFRTFNNNLRLSMRKHFSPKARSDDLGFRVVRVH